MEEISENFKTSMSEWVELKKQLSEVRQDVKVLNKREKDLKKVIMGYMKNKRIDSVNLKKGKVSLRTSKKKGAMTAPIVKAGLAVFFNNNDIEVERAMNCIRDNIEEKESDVISLTGLK